MSLVILNGSATSSLVQNVDLTLTDLGDVTISSVQNNQILKFNSSSGKFENVSVDTIVAAALSEIDGGTY